MKSTAVRASALLALAVAAGGASAQAIISNGTVQLGVRALGDLNVPSTLPAGPSGTSIIGLRSVATGSDSTSAGCTCEGWGVGIRNFGGVAGATRSGFANSSVGTANLSLVSFASTATSAVSVVNVTSGAQSILQITHDYHSLTTTPYLYETTVTIRNTSGRSLSDGDLVYRRVMDWDVPQPGQESVSIQGVPALLGLANGSNVYRTDNNGFNSGDPFTFTPFGLTNVNFTNATGDIGALFDFEFAGLVDGATRSFNTYYGVAPDKATADLARSLVNGNAADVDVGLYSYASCRSGVTGCNPTTGAPDTFIFGFGATGGVLVDPPLPPPGIPEPGSLALVGLALAGAFGATRKCKSV